MSSCGECCCWCCCCWKSFRILEDEERRKPLIGEEERQELTQKKSSGSQLYVRSVYSAFQNHFQNDEDSKILWESLSLFDILSTVYRISRYRETRIRKGLVSIPPKDPSIQFPLTPGDVKDWLFFAEAAYESKDKYLRRRLLERSHQLVLHERRCRLFEPSHYLSMSTNTDDKTIVVGIKGTSSMDDWLTNFWISKEELKVDSSLTDDEEVIGQKRDFGVHAGILHASRFVLSRIEPLLNRAFYPSGFNVILVGHSLGAGVASVLAMLLREELGMERVTCFAFAPPPAVSFFLAERSKAYIFSVVNNDDAIPRTGVKQIKTLVAGIKKLRNRKETLDGNWEQVEKELDTMPWSYLEQIFSEEWTENKFDTFIPGRILFLYDYGEKVQGYVEIPSTTPTLRLAVISSKMISDHAIPSYQKALNN